jgi:hypothetical protein
MKKHQVYFDSLDGPSIQQVVDKEFDKKLQDHITTALDKFHGIEEQWLKAKLFDNGVPLDSSKDRCNVTFRTVGAEYEYQLFIDGKYISTLIINFISGEAQVINADGFKDVRKLY